MVPSLRPMRLYMTSGITRVYFPTPPIIIFSQFLVSLKSRQIFIETHNTPASVTGFTKPGGAAILITEFYEYTAMYLPPSPFPDCSLLEGCSSLLPECSGDSPALPPLWLLQQQPAPQACAPWRGSPRQHASPPTLIKTLIALMRHNSERGKLANSY